MLHSLFTLATFLSAVSALDAWHLDDVAILVNEQIDPIVNVNAQSSHMHKVIGGSAFAASYNYDTYAKSKCSSLRLQADKSNYWMPNMYAKVNNKYISIPVNARFYYFLGRNSDSEPIVPFPEGLRILTGNPMAKTKTAEALFTCQTQGDFSQPLGGDNFNFNRDCPFGIKTDLFFPPCWDGQNLYKDDGSHVRHPIGSPNSGACPISHPVRLPAIMLEYTWLTSAVVPKVPLAGKLFWANGDSTGYGIHGDFINGWNTDLLRKALLSPGCAIGTNNAIPITECDVFKPYFASIQAMNDCKPERGILREARGNDDLIGLDTMPGCNPEWGSSGYKPTCPNGSPNLDVRALTGTDGSYTAKDSEKFSFAAPTTAGWKELMCIKEASSIQGGVSYRDPQLTPTTCQTSCSKAGYAYAAVGQIGGTWNCVCGSSINQDAGYVPGMCATPCPGDATLKCGGNYIFQVYQAGPGTKLDLPKTAGGSTILGCYSLPDDRSKGLQGSATYTYTSGSMTRDLCVTSCKQIGAKWAYTKSYDTCACGTDFNLSPGSFIPDRFCPLNCNGNAQQKCGDYYNAMVYDLSTSNSTGTPATRPEGLIACSAGAPFVKGNTFTYNSNTMTPGLCRRSCGARGFAYAGLGAGFGQRCYCSNTAPVASDEVPLAVCNVACSGDKANTCGSEGDRALSVYDTTGAGAQPPAGFPDNYLGCSQDGSPRTLPDFQFDSRTLTSSMCRDVCGSHGFYVYGTQYSFQCYCGTELGPRGFSPDSACSMGCSGNSNEKCGAGNTLSMYRVNQGGNPIPSPAPTTAVPTSAAATTAAPTSASSTTSPHATTSPASSVPGCFTSTTQSIASVFITSNAMTVASCGLWCGVNGYSYSLLTGGNSCGCKNNMAGLTRVADGQCSSPCSGASKAMCGGAGPWSVSTATPKAGLCARSMPRRSDSLEDQE